MRRVIVYMCLLAAFVSEAAATNGMRVIGTGPIQRSMGGANVGLPLDSAVTITNPAGLLKLDGRLDIGATYFDCQVRYKAHSNGGMITHDNTAISSDSSPCIIPAFGAVLPLGDRVTFGFGAYGQSGMGVDYKNNLYRNKTYTKYQLMKFSPAIAYSVSNKLSLGAALNCDYATMEFEAGTINQVAHDDGKAYGIGLTVGAHYEATNRLSLGFAYESKQHFTEFRFDTSGGRDKMDFDQPQSVTLGLGLKPCNTLRVAFDVSWIDWPQTNGKNKPVYTKNGSGAATWNLSWDEQYVYKLGAEYDFDETITLRAGYNYGRNPLDSSRAFENIAFPAIAEHHITAGVGIRLKEDLEINLGFMYAPKVSLDTANSAQFIDAAKTEMSQYSVSMGLAYRS